MPVPIWAGRYIGLPFQGHGRDRSGLDCWGLVRLVMAEQFGIALPSHTQEYERTTQVEKIASLVEREAKKWKIVPSGAEDCGDVIVLLVGKGAAAAGAELRFEEPALDWSAGPTGVSVRTATGTYAAGALVLTPGAWAPRLLADLGLPLVVERQVMHWLAPAGPIEPYAANPVFVCGDGREQERGDENSTTHEPTSRVNRTSRSRRHRAVRVSPA